MIEDFGAEWFENNVRAEFTNRVRQSVRQHHSNALVINSAAIDSVDSEVKQAMTDYVALVHLPTEVMDVTVGRANPPPEIIAQRVETAREQQRKLTEDQRKLAEDARR